MTVILVLFTFGIFILVDYWLSRGQEVQPARAVSKTPALQLRPAFVEGFSVPTGLRYHPGHAWLSRERAHVYRVGLDEFAARLAGKLSGIELPKPGQWIRQGQKAWKLARNGQNVAMVSPTEGEVLEVNPEVVANPSLMQSDPYGKGWLMTIHVPDEEGTGHNLVPKSLVGAWMREAAQRLYAQQPQLAGAVAAEGGRPVEDLTEALGGERWAELAEEFFLS
jgi:glycine cleavage system H protein